MNVTDAFVEYIYDLSSTVLPERVTEKAKHVLLDYLGVTYAGAFQAGGSLDACIQAGEGDCTLLGCGGAKVSVSTAAFVNGFHAHLMELDDGHRFGMLHLGAVIIPAVLALGQQERISLDRILHGIVVGYEAAARLAVSMQPGHKKAGYHTTGTCGTIGAALGCAAALSMDRMQMKAVLSAAASSAAGLLEIQENASQLKAYNAGQAAMAGAGAVLIGKCRLKGPDDILGGDRGFLRIHSATVSEETLVKRDNPLEIERIYVKPYAACRHCHSAMEAAMQLRSRLQAGAEEIEEILIDTYQLAIRGHDHREIKGVESAKLSIPYSVAAAYILNSGSLDAFSESSVNQAEILMLARKVKVRENPEFTALAPGKRIAEVRVVTVAGHLARARVEYAKGDPENPMTEDELKDKFMGLMQYCGREEQAKALLECFASATMTSDALFGLI